MQLSGKMVLQNRRIAIKEIIAEHKVFYGAIEKILHDRLGLGNVTASGVSKSLSSFEKENRVTLCKEILQRFQGFEKEFLGRIASDDEVGLSHYDPESQQQSAQGKYPGSPRPVRARIEFRTGKALATIL